MRKSEEEKTMKIIKSFYINIGPRCTFWFYAGSRIIENNFGVVFNNPSPFQGL